MKPIDITNENTRTVTANFDFIFSNSNDGKWYLKDLWSHNSNDIGIEMWIK